MDEISVARAQTVVLLGSFRNSIEDTSSGELGNATLKARIAGTKILEL